MKIEKNLRYKIIPQMKAYDTLGWEFLPHIMFTQSPNFRSKIINTDKRGFRFSSKIIKNDIFENRKKRETILFIGGSAAFGVGASKDSRTIPGILEKKSKYNILNLAGRGYSGFQESISLISNLKELKKHKIKKIIVFSGINDLYLSSFFSVRYPGIFYFNSDFIYAMNNSFFSIKKKILIKILNFFLGFQNDINNYDFRKLDKSNILKFIFSRKSRKKLFLKQEYVRLGLNEIIDRNLTVYKSLEKIFNCKVEFVFQPVLRMCKIPSNEEKKLLEYSEFYFAEQNKQLNRFLSLRLYKKYSSLMEKISTKNKIKFLDINKLLKKRDLKSQNLFVDNVHLNDNGNEVISDYILKLIK